MHVVVAYLIKPPTIYIYLDKKFIEYVLESDETQDGRECDELQGP
jgi:hypothetical protein